jgi:hypothetical protein
MFYILNVLNMFYVSENTVLFEIVCFECDFEFTAKKTPNKGRFKFSF